MRKRFFKIMLIFILLLFVIGMMAYVYAESSSNTYNIYAYSSGGTGQSGSNSRTMYELTTYILFIFKIVDAVLIIGFLIQIIYTLKTKFSAQKKTEIIENYQQKNKIYNLSEAEKEKIISEKVKQRVTIYVVFLVILVLIEMLLNVIKTF